MTLTTHPSVLETRYLDVEAAGRYIGVVKAIENDPDPVRTLRRQLQRIYSMIYRGSIPFIKRGKRVYFDREQLDQWMRVGAHQS